MQTVNRDRVANTNRSAPQKHRVTLKDFRALSFDVMVQNSVLRSAPRGAACASPQGGKNDDPRCSTPPGGEASSSSRPVCDRAPVATSLPKPAPARVLIADDTPAVRESLAKLLRAEGYEVELALNGRETLEKFDPRRIDLVLLDLDMPVTHGWAVLEQLLALNPEQAVIIITGRPEPCRWAGVSPAGALIEKPINATELLDAIRQILAEPLSSRKERVAVQQNLLRHTRPLAEAFRWKACPHGGINE